MGSPNLPELSSRYYIAEASVWVLGLILLVARFLGLASSQSLPILNITLENQQDFSRVVAAMLAATTLYLILEWKQSSKESRRSYWAQARAGFTILFSCISLWLCYSLIAANTSFASTSPTWYFTFIAVGFLIGSFMSVIVLASLVIRTQEEAKTINLPRVPVATYAVFKGAIPIVITLLIIYYILYYFTPKALQLISPILVAITYFFMLGGGLVFLYFSRDEKGNRVPYRKKIAQFKEAFNSHDYHYVLHRHEKQAAQILGIPIDADPKVIQKTIREKLSDTQPQTPVNFRGQLLEEIQLKFYVKDGNPKNQSPNNCGVKIYKPHGNKETLRALFIPVDPNLCNQEITIPINLVESYAEEYISTHPDPDNEALRKLLSFALNQAMIKSMMDQTGHLLHRAVESGQEQQVRDLLKQNFNVNERAEAVWTPLLMAAAQGYPKIMKLLLDAGANPDIGNVHKITPLMYGARYKNIEVCKLLLEAGANPDLQDVYGQTALMVATNVGSADVAGMLLKAKANTNIKDRDDMTALDIAYKNKQGKIAKMIRKAKSTK